MIRSSVPPMASQFADTGGDENQVHPLRSPIPSVRGKANRHHSTRVFGSHVVLDDGRSRKQAARFQDLLQQPSHAYLTGRANAGYAGVTTNRKSPLVSMAAPLSIPVSDPYGCLIFKDSGSLRYPVNLGKTCKKSFGVSPSQRASRLRSFHCHRVRPKSETQLTFAARLPVKSAPRNNSPDHRYCASLKISKCLREGNYFPSAVHGECYSPTGPRW